MKQRRLLVALTLMLAMLALVLSGCYVAPDDVSTSQQSGDNLNFPTLNPATAAPTNAAQAASANVVMIFIVCQPRNLDYHSIRA